MIVRAYKLLIFFLVFAGSSHALAQVVPITTDSRIRTLVYNPNEVHELKFHHGYQSFIEFAEDEEIQMISIGEPFSWRLTPAGKRLFIRPLDIASRTNMTVITNKRTYNFDIKSGEYDGRADEELVYIIRFFYPQIGQSLPVPPQLTLINPAAPKLPLKPIKEGPGGRIKTPMPKVVVGKELPKLVARAPEGSGELNFDYSLAGKSDEITPVKVYDDGEQTFFQFKNDNNTIPSISSVDIYGNEQLLTYIIKDGYVVVPVSSIQFTLRLGNGLICIYNNKMMGVTNTRRR